MWKCSPSHIWCLNTPVCQALNDSEGCHKYSLCLCLQHPPGSGGQGQSEDDVELEEDQEGASAPGGTQNNNSVPDSASPMDMSPDASTEPETRQDSAETRQDSAETRQDSAETRQDTVPASRSERPDTATTGPAEPTDGVPTSTPSGARDSGPGIIK